MGEHWPNVEAHTPACSSGCPLTVPMLVASSALPAPPWAFSAWARMDPQGGPWWHVLVHLDASHHPHEQRPPCWKAKLCMVPSPAHSHFLSTPLGRAGHRSHLGAFLEGLEGGQLPGQTNCAGSLGFTDLNDMETGGWVSCASALELTGALLHTRVTAWAWPE